MTTASMFGDPTAAEVGGHVRRGLNSPAGRSEFEVLLVGDNVHSNCQLGPFYISMFMRSKENPTRCDF